MKILLIIEILIFFIRWFLGNCIKDNLDDIIFKIKNIPQVFFENAIKQYNEAEIKESDN